MESLIHKIITWPSNQNEKRNTIKEISLLQRRDINPLARVVAN